MGKYENIVVFGEMDNDHLSPLTAQLMRIGKDLTKDLKQKLYLLLLGEEFPKFGEIGYQYGADKVYAAIDPLLENYISDAYLQAMEQIILELKPAIILFGHNDRGIDLAPRLAFRLKTGVTLDCIDLKINPKDGSLEQVKPVFGGKAHCLYSNTGRLPQIVSVQEGAFDTADCNKSINGKVIQLSLLLDPSKIRMRFLGKEKDESLFLALKLVSSSIVVCGGRGLKKRTGVEIIRETANLLDGAIAGSRPAVENGWLPSSLQVGLTGKKVHPQLYIAVGISGAIQHMAGCLKSGTIVAINSDESAPIFSMSRFGALGDYREILEGFNEMIRHYNEKRVESTV